MFRTTAVSLTRTLPTKTSTRLSAIGGIRTFASAAAAPPPAGYAVSNVELADIENRWEGMPPNEQAQLWMSLRDRMKGSWGELTWQEKKASYWIAFGPHGPRAEPPPGEGLKVFLYTMAGLGVAFITFYAVRLGGRPAPKTMSKEWQEATNEYLKEQKVEPISGISSEGYKGPGYVQNK